MAVPYERWESARRGWRDDEECPLRHDGEIKFRGGQGPAKHSAHPRGLAGITRSSGRSTRLAKQSTFGLVDQCGPGGSPVRLLSGCAEHDIDVTDERNALPHLQVVEEGSSNDTR